MGFFILIKQLRHEKGQLVVDVNHNHIDDFVQDAVVFFFLKLFVLFFLLYVFLCRKGGMHLVGFRTQLRFEGFAQLGKLFVLFFDEQTLDIGTHHVGLELNSDSFTILLGHGEDVSIDFLELLHRVAYGVNSLTRSLSFALDHQVEKLNQSDPDSVLFADFAYQLNLLVRNVLSISYDVSNDCFERLSNIIAFLVLQKSHINFLREREIKPASIQILTEIFLQSTNLRNEGNSQLFLQVLCDLRRLSLWLF